MVTVEDTEEVTVTTPLLRLERRRASNHEEASEATIIQNDLYGCWEDIARVASPTLLIVALCATTNISICTVISFEPSTILHDKSQLRLMEIVFSLLFTFGIVCILIQKVIFMKRHDIYIVKYAQTNVFMLFCVVFIFMPFAVTCLLVRLMETFPCGDVAHIIEISTEIIFIISVAGYTLKLSGRRISGGWIGVACTKITIVALQAGCICFWLREIVMKEGLKIQSKNWTHEACHGRNSTAPIKTIYQTTEYYLHSFLVDFLLASATLLYLPYRRSKRGPIVLTECPQQSIPFWRRLLSNWQPLPIMCGLTQAVVFILTLLVNFFTTKDTFLKQAMPFIWALAIVNFGTCIFINTLLFIQIYKLPKQRCELQADRILLWLATFGTMLRGLILFHANAVYLSLPRHQHHHAQYTSFYINNLCFYFVFFVQTMWQTFTLDISLHRKLDGQDVAYARWQPALILLLAHVGLWANGIELKKDFAVKLPGYILKIYGEHVWTVLQSVMNPLNNLFRIHCATILFKIFRSIG